MARTCVFCGNSNGLTGEHVFGDWLTKIGLNLDPVMHVAGPLNRITRELGVRPPFRQTVRNVCGNCNNGWMSNLENVAHRVLMPLILGKSSLIEPSDFGAIATWLQKTALIGMLVSSHDERAQGYGLPATEYKELYGQHQFLEPLPTTHVWIGQCDSRSRTGSIWVVPLIVIAEGQQESDYPQGYSITIVLGELLLHGIRFTASELDLKVHIESSLFHLWPSNIPIFWPGDSTVDDAGVLRLGAGKGFQLSESDLALRPWKRATELSPSRAVGSMVELPIICGKHVINYPSFLVEEAKRGRFFAFISSCECRTAYLIQTEADGARCKAAGEAEGIIEMYSALPGEELMYGDCNGSFTYKMVDGVVLTDMD